MTTAHLSHFIASIEDSALAPWASLAPWQLTAQSEAIVRQMLHTLDASQFRMLRGARSSSRGDAMDGSHPKSASGQKGALKQALL